MLKIRAYVVPMFVVYGMVRQVATSGYKKRVDAFELWRYLRLLRATWVERKTDKWVLEKIGSVLRLRKSMGGRKMRSFGRGDGADLQRPGSRI